MPHVIIQALEIVVHRRCIAFNVESRYSAWGLGQIVK